VERLAYYKMGPALGPPETTIFEYPMADDSWSREWEAFTEDIRLGRQPEPGIADAQAALRVVEEVYRKSAATDTSADGRSRRLDYMKAAPGMSAAGD
jgi:predicted dehydrogenase